MAEILQFRVELLDVAPTVWRVIELQLPATFWDLHCAIQDAMGWKDCHLHEFELAGTSGNVRVGLCDEDGFSDGALLGWDCDLGTTFEDTEPVFEYTYDFGDDWRHQVTLEGRQRASPEIRYPRCVGGARRCPPEDVGGPDGYEDFLVAMRDKTHPEHREMRRWYGRTFDPEQFDPAKVRFTSPMRRLRMLSLPWRSRTSGCGGAGTTDVRDSASGFAGAR